MRLAFLSASAALALAGCALMPKTVPEANTEFKPSGEVVIRGRTAGFDAVRVRSVNCNLAKRTDGSWGGTFQERAVDVSVTDTHIRGVDVILTRQESQKGHLIITGNFNGKMARFEVDGDKVLVRTPVTSRNLTGRTDEGAVVKYGSLQELELRGEAGVENPPWPQIAFALLSVFN